MLIWFILINFDCDRSYSAYKTMLTYFPEINQYLATGVKFRAEGNNWNIEVIQTHI